MAEPSIDNGFLIEGRECECDPETSCRNHDSAAEVAYWFRYYSQPMDVHTITLRADRVYGNEPY
jgi:hypothetical protein